MTTPGTKIKVDDLNAVARALVTGAQGFEDAPAPTAPDAGVSAGPIGEFMASLADATSTAAVSTGNAADTVQAALTKYDHVDHRNGQQLDDAGQNIQGTARGSTR
ncbi:hypothetical protein [Antrihabitans cavernicola]|uniref:Uncharacterized protein n=1 Tax=Antrihabitans cavernicola TaxID=2495913 RepID=A0A5A7SE52_9NOCA|nr:hypothetical protein [Spelaeibacter cavernicola]KAA0024440.1 hypothetical protein FOY51_00255 [Spelaeibacter cavernicola]